MHVFQELTHLEGLSAELLAIDYSISTTLAIQTQHLTQPSYSHLGNYAHKVETAAF